jgi:hypothetical protein
MWQFGLWMELARTDYKSAREIKKWVELAHTDYKSAWNMSREGFQPSCCSWAKHQGNSLLLPALHAGLIQQGTQHFPYILGHNAMAFRGGVDAVGQVELGVAAYALEQKRD